MKLVIAYRAHQFPFRFDAHPLLEPDKPKKKRRKRKRCADPGGTGQQIVRELMVCPAYASAAAE